jgi:hypothetical protein
MLRQSHRMGSDIVSLMLVVAAFDRTVMSILEY